MTRKRIIVFASVAFVVLAAVIALLCVGKSKSVLTQGETGVTAEAAVKAKENEFIMRIVEGKDIDFSDFSQAEMKEAISNTASRLENGFCKSVTVKVNAFTKSYDAKTDGKEPDTQKNAAFFSFAKKLAEKKIKVYVELDFSFPASYAKALASEKSISAVVITGVKKTEAKKVNSKLSSLYKAVNGQADKRLVLSISPSYPYFSSLKLDENHVDLYWLSLSLKDNETDIQKAVGNLASLAEKGGGHAGVMIGLSGFSQKKLNPGRLLELFWEIENSGRFKAVCFHSYSDAKDNEDNFFSAVEQYVSKGVVRSAALRTLSVDGYNGEVLETDSYHLTLTVRGSDLYPATLDGEEFFFDADGRADMELSLKTGLNQFAFSQNGKKLTYQVKVSFRGELIKSVEPMPNLTAYTGKKSTVTVYAASGSEVTVKAGTKKVRAKALDGESDGYCRYKAEIRMPDSRMELESIGKIYVTAVLGDETATAEGPNVVYSVPETTTASSVTLPAANSGKEPATAFSGGNVSVSGLTQNLPETTAVSVPPSSLMTYTGNQMCVVTANYADTWPSGTNSDAFVPYYTTLAAGTMDYIVGQSEAYDSEEEKTRYFYELSCGRRVQRDDVMLLEKYDMGQNSFTVSSVTANGGELQIVLSTKWKVPYSFSFAPQTYRSGYNKSYNVDSFTAESIQFTFYHTVSASGSIDTSQSTVVSSASWGVDSSSGAVTLTMPLRSKGKYYGYSLTYDSGDNMVLTIRSRPQSLQGAVILLDPGHGGKDPGTLGYAGAVEEADLNFNTAVAVMNALQKKGATVYLTRYEDKTLSLEERKSIARSIKPTVFISIHGNGSVNASNYGTSAYYFRPMSQPLAECIYGELVTAWQGLYASSPEKLSKIPDGCDFHPFSVTRLEECPSVLLEVGYVTNDSDCAFLADVTSRERLAAAIANGIEKFILS